MNPMKRVRKCQYLLNGRAAFMSSDCFVLKLSPLQVIWCHWQVIHGQVCVPSLHWMCDYIFWFEAARRDSRTCHKRRYLTHSTVSWQWDGNTGYWEMCVVGGTYTGQMTYKECTHLVIEQPKGWYIFHILDSLFWQKWWKYQVNEYFKEQSMRWQENGDPFAL